MKINISEDFTKTPGGRFEKDGKYSGEEFRKKILEKKYAESKKLNEKLEIDMNGCFGFPPSFLEEAFGGLARLLKNKKILENIIIISNDEPLLKERIAKYIENSY